MICSFDVFDTVLVRVFARPTDLFAALFNGDNCVGEGGRLPKMDANDFVKARTEAERRARRLTTAEEITIEAIYRELGDALELAPQERLALMRAEIDLEVGSVHPVPAIVTQIRQARAEGKRVIFVSDMYLPATVIRSMLEACGAYRAGDGLYVSNEAGATKATGGLYRHVLAEEGVEPRQLFHTGDNAHADVERARESGMQTRHFTDAYLNRYERILADAAKVSLPARSQLAGISRLTRLNCPYQDGHRRVVWATAANVAAPVLVGYVAWLLTDAHRRGIQRLYFLSRDGQILLRLAQVISRKLDLAIDCRYLYASRQAWHLPAVNSLGELEYGWILAQTDFLSVDAVLRRVDLSPAEVASQLTASGLDPAMWQKNLDAAERERLSEWIVSGALDHLILEKARQKRLAAHAYLAQEGLIDPVRCAIVDIGWGGRLQTSLRKILALCGCQRPLRGYYLGLLGRIGAHPEDRLDTYLWDYERDAQQYHVGVQTRMIMEVFTAADHGGVKEYQVGKHRVEPVLLAEKNEHALRWGLQAQQEAIVQFVNGLSRELLESLGTDPAWPELVADLLLRFYRSPTRVEAEVFGQWRDAEDQNEVFFQPLASPYGLDALLRALRAEPAYHHHNEWTHAARAMTPKPTYYSLRLIEKLHALRRTIVRARA